MIEIVSGGRTVERYPSGAPWPLRLKSSESMATEVRVVDGTAEFGRFVDYPYEINARDPHWIPPLRMSERERLTPAKNPFFAHAQVELMLAWRGRGVVGRIAAIDDRLHNEHHADTVAMFGFFEAADTAAARSLPE